MKYIQYGGALFDARCPECCRIVKPRKSMSVNRFMLSVIHKANPTAPALCRNCGSVHVKFVKFEDAA